MSLFISFEGPEGSGKSTIIQEVAKELKTQGYDVLVTREPGGIAIAEEIRSLILDPNNTEMDDRTEALLYAASRRQHVVEKIIPALDDNKIVLCDRFIDSSLAYQGYAREIGVDEVFQINKFAIENCMPNLTLFFDVDPEIGMQRIGKRGFKDRLEQEGKEFHDKVYEGYQMLLEKYSNRIKRVDASQEIEEVLKSSLLIIEDKINE